MRILHLYKDYSPVLGGIENHVRVLAEAEAARGLDVTVAVCAPKGAGLPRESLEDGVRVLRLPRLWTFRSLPISPAYWFAARRLARDADVVHVHSPFPLGEAAVRSLPRNIRLLVTHHSDVVRQRFLLRFYAPLYRVFLGRADLILPTSSAYAASSPWLRTRLGKCRTLPLGVDTHRFHPAPSCPCGESSEKPPSKEAKAALPQSLLLPLSERGVAAQPPGGVLRATPKPQIADAPSAFRLLFVGKLRYYKGLDTLLRAMAELPDSIRLDIVGSGPKGPEWQALSRRLGLNARVNFHGEIPDANLPDVYRSADLFVLPCNCRAEAFGTVLAEALASGLPCLTCEVGSGTTSVVRDGVTGRVVPPSDPAALATAIRQLAADRPTLEKMALAARQDALARLSEEVMVESMMDILSDL